MADAGIHLPPGGMKQSHRTTREMELSRGLVFQPRETGSGTHGSSTIISLHSVQYRSISRAMLPPKALGENPSLLLLDSGGSRHPWLVAIPLQSLPMSSHVLPSLPALYSPFLSACHWT